MVPPGDQAFDPADAVGGALVDAAVAARDARLIETGLRIYRHVRDQVDPVVRRAGTPVLAFPSVLQRPGGQRDCLVVVMAGSILVAWPGSPLRAEAGAFEIDKSAVARVEITPAAPGDHFLSVLTLEGTFGRCSIGLPRGATVFGVWLRGAVGADRP